MYSPELTKAEAEYCKSNFTHKWHAHPKWIVSASFAVSILLAAGFTWISLAPCDSAFILSVFTIFLLLAFSAWLPMPCNCGSVPLLSSEMRRTFAQGEQNLLNSAISEGRVTLLSTPFGVMMLNLALIATSLVCGELVPHKLQCLFTSMPALICLPINLVAWSKIPQIRSITQAEIARNGAADGRTADELKEQIALNLYIGNFERAEMCSKKLLSLAEQD